MVLICWGVIYERKQGMLRIEYRYKCPTVVRGRRSSPTTLDLESNSPQRSQAACSGHSYRPKLDLWQGTWPDHLLWGWLAVAWVHLLKHLEYRCCCSCDLCIEQVNSHESTWWSREQQQPGPSRRPKTSLFHLCGFETENEVGRRKFGENVSIFLNSWPQSSWWIQGLDRR